MMAQLRDLPRSRAQWSALAGETSDLIRDVPRSCTCPWWRAPGRFLRVGFDRGCGWHLRA